MMKVQQVVLSSVFVGAVVATHEGGVVAGLRGKNKNKTSKATVDIRQVIKDGYNQIEENKKKVASEMGTLRSEAKNSSKKKENANIELAENTLKMVNGIIYTHEQRRQELQREASKEPSDKEIQEMENCTQAIKAAQEQRACAEFARTVAHYNLAVLNVSESSDTSIREKEFWEKQIQYALESKRALQLAPAVVKETVSAVMHNMTHWDKTNGEVATVKDWAKAGLMGAARVKPDEKECA